MIDVGKKPDGSRNQKSKTGFKTRKEAEAALSRLRYEIGEGRYIEPSREPLGEFLIREWLPAIRKEIRESTFDSYRSNVEAHIVPHLGPIPLAALTPARIKQFHSDLLEGGRRKNGTGGLSPRTVGYIHMILRRALRDAVSWERLRSNPTDGVRRPKAHESDATDMRPWTAEQARMYLAFVAEDRLYPLFVLALTTGMRRGEIVGLRWEDVDFEECRLQIRRTVVLVGNKVVESAPKTKRSRRTISLDVSTVAAIRTHKARQAEERLAWGPAYVESGRVFTFENGAPIHPRTLSGIFTRLVRAAGVPMIRFHDLRHTYATVALRDGVNPKIVSERLGHHSVAFTFDVYAHFLPGDDRTAAEQFAARFFGSV